MDAWRIGLLIAAACFVLFLLVKMRPRTGSGSGSTPRESNAERREKRIRRRIVQLAGELSPEALAALRKELDQL